jgi:hypothetical protein
VREMTDNLRIYVISKCDECPKSTEVMDDFYICSRTGEEIDLSEIGSKCPLALLNK